MTFSSWLSCGQSCSFWRFQPSNLKMIHFLVKVVDFTAELTQAHVRFANFDPHFQFQGKICRLMASSIHFQSRRRFFSRIRFYMEKQLKSLKNHEKASKMAIFSGKSLKLTPNPIWHFFSIHEKVIKMGIFNRIRFKGGNHCTTSKIAKKRQKWLLFQIVQIQYSENHPKTLKNRIRFFVYGFQKWAFLTVYGLKTVYGFRLPNRIRFWPKIK